MACKLRQLCHLLLFVLLVEFKTVRKERRDGGRERERRKDRPTQSPTPPPTPSLLPSLEAAALWPLQMATTLLGLLSAVSQLFERSGGQATNAIVPKRKEPRWHKRKKKETREEDFFFFSFSFSFFFFFFSFFFFLSTCWLLLGSRQEAEDGMNQGGHIIVFVILARVCLQTNALNSLCVQPE